MNLPLVPARRKLERSVALARAGPVVLDDASVITSRESIALFVGKLARSNATKGKFARGKFHEFATSFFLSSSSSSATDGEGQREDAKHVSVIGTKSSHE